MGLQKAIPAQLREIDYKNRRNLQNRGNRRSADFYDTLARVSTDKVYNFGKGKYFCLAGAWGELEKGKIGQLLAARCSRFSKQTNLSLYFSNYYLCSYPFYVFCFARPA